MESASVKNSINCKKRFSCITRLSSLITVRLLQPGPLNANHNTGSKQENLVGYVENVILVLNIAPTHSVNIASSLFYLCLFSYEALL